MYLFIYTEAKNSNSTSIKIAVVVQEILDRCGTGTGMYVLINTLCICVNWDIFTDNFGEKGMVQLKMGVFTLFIARL